MAKGGFHPLKWFLTNKYGHIEAFLKPSLEHGAVSQTLRRRMQKRLKNAKRLVKVRAALYGLLALSLITAVAGYAFDLLAQITEAGWVETAEGAFTLLVVIVSPLAILATPALFVVMRALSLLEAELYVFGMEVVTANAGAPDGILPSTVHIGQRASK